MGPNTKDHLSAQVSAGAAFDQHPIWVLGPDRTREAEDADGAGGPGIVDMDMDVVMSGTA